MPEIVRAQVSQWLQGIAAGVLDLRRDNEGFAAAALEALRAPAAQDIERTPMPTLAPSPDVLPSAFLREIVDPALSTLSILAGTPSDDRARVIVLAIAGQESAWKDRRQRGGPARSFWQFEKGGGVAQLFKHTPDQLRAVCAALSIPFDQTTVFEAMAWNDDLAGAMARLLLWTDSRPLPQVGDEAGAWNYYLDNWRPGAPHPEAWPGNYGKALAAITA